MKIVFMGTAQFAVASLKALIDAGQTISGVVTQPDKPSGRRRKLSSSPIKEQALQHKLSLIQPVSIKSPDALEQIQAWQPDLIVVVAYGQIIPATILELPPSGCINVHGSLLPRYRGAAPIQRAIMNGETQTGVTTMYMDEGVDTGDMIMQAAIPIDDLVDYGELQQQLAQVGADLLLKTVAAIAAGTAPREKQESSLATYAPALKAADELIQWEMKAVDIHNQIRALSPQPGAFTRWQGSKLKVYKSRVASFSGQGTPGLVEASGSGLVVQTGQGRLELLEVQKEGRKRMPIRDFMAGQRGASGIMLGS